MFPSTDILHHFHPIAWVRQMKMIAGSLDIKAGIDWLNSIAITKENLDNNPNYYKVYYKNDVTTPLRTAQTKLDESNLDCSELVCRYLQKIGWSEEVKWLNTKGLYDYAEKYPSSLEKHESKDYKPSIGDIFLWKRDSGMGHTGVIVNYDETNDAVTTIEAISENEYPSRKGDNSGHKGYRFKGVIKWKWSKRLGSHLLGSSHVCRFYTPNKLKK